MARPFKIPPTKSNLLDLQERVVFLEKGYDLLERKRELLTRLVYERLAEYRSLRSQVQERLTSAYRSLAVTQMRVGSRMLHQAGLGIAPPLRLRILPRSSVGVQYPSVRVTREELEPVSLLWTDATFDDTRARMRDLAEILARLGEVENVLRRLLQEQWRTQKRVNALHHNVIPRYQATIHYIQSQLEEEERNTLFQIQRLREQGGAD